MSDLLWFVGPLLIGCAVTDFDRWMGGDWGFWALMTVDVVCGVAWLL